VRRKFIEVKKLSPKEVERVLKLIAKLYAVEKKVKGISETEDRARKRQKESLPVLEKIKEYLEALRDRTLLRDTSILITIQLRGRLDQWL